MIHTFKTAPAAGQTLEFDACVIGTGAGGAAAAERLSKRGWRVVLIEGGHAFTPRDFNQREEHMYPRLFHDGGGRRTADRAIRVLHGHGVGGSTLHNINLCKRAPDAVVKAWNLPGLGSAEFAPYLDEIEKRLEVQPIDSAWINPANAVIRKGTESLGWKGGILSHNRRGCVGSGFCELGCAFDAKLNAARVLIPQAIERGAEVYADTRALKLEWSGKRASALHVRTAVPAWHEQAAAVGPREWRIKAKVFVAACGAVETPTLLDRSGVPDPHGQLGRHLHLHPGAALAGLFEDPIECWKGIPQSYECTEHLSFEAGSDKRAWIVGGSAHPAGIASMLPGFGPEHRELMARYPRLSPLSAMVHDETEGRVSAQGETGAVLDYVLSAADRRQLSLGLKASARILFAGGAQEVLVPLRDVLRLKSADEVEKIPEDIVAAGMDLVAVHPMGSVRMGTDPESSCVDVTGRYHPLDNLYVADASLFPTSLGVPPQVSTYAMGFWVADRIA